MRLCKPCLCIDIDDTDSLAALKALYQFNYLYKRKIYQSRSGGLHVYIYDLPHNFVLRVLFGDDELRIEYDEMLTRFKSKCHINVMFQTSEIFMHEIPP